MAPSKYGLRQDAAGVWRNNYGEVVNPSTGMVDVAADNADFAKGKADAAKAKTDAMKAAGDAKIAGGANPASVSVSSGRLPAGYSGYQGKNGFMVQGPNDQKPVAYKDEASAMAALGNKAIAPASASPAAAPTAASASSARLPAGFTPAAPSETPAVAGPRAAPLEPANTSGPVDRGANVAQTISQGVVSGLATGARQLGVSGAKAALGYVPLTQAAGRLAALATSVPVNAANFSSPSAASNAGAKVLNASAKAMEKGWETAVKQGAKPVSREVFKNAARSAAIDTLATTGARAASRANLVGSALWEGNKVVGKALSDKDTGDLTAAEAVGYALSGRTPEGVLKDEIAPQDAASTRAFDKLMSARRARANVTDPKRAAKIDEEIAKRTANLREEMAKRRLP